MAEEKQESVVDETEEPELLDNENGRTSSALYGTASYAFDSYGRGFINDKWINAVLPAFDPSIHAEERRDQLTKLCAGLAEDEREEYDGEKFLYTNVMALSVLRSILDFALTSGLVKIVPANKSEEN